MTILTPNNDEVRNFKSSRQETMVDSRFKTVWCGGCVSGMSRHVPFAFRRIEEE
jgi:hypothetical protein